GVGDRGGLRAFPDRAPARDVGEARTEAGMILERSDGLVRIEAREPALHRVSVRPAGGRRAPRYWCDTAYPVELIRAILDVKGAAWVCDEIAREEDPREIQRAFE